MANAAQIATIEGRVQAVLSAKQSFRLLRIETGNQRITVKGFQPLCELKAGDDVRLTGTWTTHPQYGRQFDARDAAKVVPATPNGIARWIEQIGIPGVGAATSAKLAGAFGKTTVERVVSGDPKAREILGRHFNGAVAALTPLQAEASFGQLLAAHDIGPKTREKIFKEYGMRTVQIVERDPYKLIVDVDGVAFATADRIAKATGMVATSETRVSAALVDVLRNAATRGHTALDDGEIAKGVAERLATTAPHAASLIEGLQVRGVADIEIEGASGRALIHLLRAETAIAEAVTAKLEQVGTFTAKFAEELVKEACRQLKTTLNAEQHAAAIMALSTPISILTGGPGTGKTHTLKVITLAWRLGCEMRRIAKRTIELGAPTGKAAKQITRSTKMPARTLHRLLEIGANGQFARDENKPLECGQLIVDETSMLDAEIGGSVVAAWGEANVLLVGDADQLASVGAGRVFGDLIDSGVVPVTRLVENRRTGDGSDITKGAASVRDGIRPWMGRLGSSDLVHIESDDNEWIQQKIVDFAVEMKDRDLQVLTPGHKGDVGTIALNAAIRGAIETAEGSSIRISGGQTVREGAKVMQSANDYDRDVFNGDAGVVQAITLNAQGKPVKAIVDFDGEIREYAPDQFAQMACADAISIHKSQGSEYDVVVIPLTTSHYGMLSRTLLYTAMTRAKRLCIIIGSERALNVAIANDDGAARCTMLAQLLRQMSAAA